MPSCPHKLFTIVLHCEFHNVKKFKRNSICVSAICHAYERRKTVLYTGHCQHATVMSSFRDAPVNIAWRHQQKQAAADGPTVQLVFGTEVVTRDKAGQQTPHRTYTDCICSRTACASLHAYQHRHSSADDE